MLSKLKNFFSIFTWKKDEEGEKKATRNKVVSPVISEFKKYCESELPPLAWERIVFKTLKYTLQLYNKSLKDFQDNETIPENLQDKIRTLVLEVYQKEITFGQVDRVSHV